MKWKIAVTAVALLLAISIGALSTSYLMDANGNGRGPAVAVLIRPGDTLSKIADELAQNGVIKGPEFFKLYIEFHSAIVDAGVYFFHRDESYGTAMSILMSGPESSRLVVTPGETLLQVAQELSRLPGEANAAKSFLELSGKPDIFGSPYASSSTPTLEGLIYPDTYFVDPLDTTKEVMQEMVDRMTQEAESVGLYPGRSYNGLSAYQVLVAASIVEKEANNQVDARKVARVILNRLANHMPLQMDSTVRYATRNYRNPITRSELASTSAYNTYVRTGLPPTPIGCVDRQAIQAVLDPASGPWLYFVQLDGHTSESFFTKYSSFEQAVKRYGVK